MPRHHSLRPVAAIVAAGALLLALAAPVFAQEPKPVIDAGGDTGGGTATVGGEVTVTGEGFTAGEEVTIYFGSPSCGVVEVGTATVGADGTIERTVTVPDEVNSCEVDAGPWEVVAATGDPNEGAVKEVDLAGVTPGATLTPPVTSTLPTPRADGGAPLLAVLFLLGAGLAAFAFGLRSFPARSAR